MYLAGLIVLLVTATVDGWPGGAPVDACASMTPLPGDNGHGATPNIDDEFPYEVTFSKTCFAEGDTIDVTVKVKDGQDTATNFKGVLLQARKGSSPNTAEYYGTWDVLSSNLRILNCGTGANNTITHKDNTDKTSETVRWIAPAASVLSSDVLFRVTVVQVKANFWVNRDSSVLQYGTTCGATSFTMSAALVATVVLIKFLF